MADVYSFKVTEGGITQHIVYIKGDKEKIGFCECPKRGAYMIIDKSFMPRLRQDISEGDIQPVSVDASGVDPVMIEARKIVEEGSRTSEGLTRKIGELVASLDR